MNQSDGPTGNGLLVKITSPKAENVTIFRSAWFAGESEDVA